MLLHVAAQKLVLPEDEAVADEVVTHGFGFRSVGKEVIASMQLRQDQLLHRVGKPPHSRLEKS